MSRNPQLKTIKRLFALSGNCCAFPGCDLPLIEESGTATGEIAHIRAESPGGPRYDPVQSDADRQSFANLILLCPRHHAIVDKEPDAYPSDVLAEFKARHEERGVVEIGAQTDRAARSLLEAYEFVDLSNNCGHINLAIGSPGAIQAKVVNVGVAKSKVQIQPPEGAVGANRRMCSYVEYLVPDRKLA